MENFQFFLRKLWKFKSAPQSDGNVGATCSLSIWSQEHWRLPMEAMCQSLTACLIPLPQPGARQLGHSGSPSPGHQASPCRQGQAEANGWPWFGRAQGKAGQNCGELETALLWLCWLGLPAPGLMESWALSRVGDPTGLAGKAGSAFISFVLSSLMWEKNLPHCQFSKHSMVCNVSCNVSKIQNTKYINTKYKYIIHIYT